LQPRCFSRGEAVAAGQAGKALTVGSDGHGLAADSLRVHPGDVEEGTRGRRRKKTAAPDPNDAIHRLDHVSVASQRERHVGITHDHDRLEPAQVLVHTPPFRHLYARAQSLRVLLQLHLEPLEERHRVRGRACKPADHTLLDLPHLACVRLDHLITKRNLAVADEKLRAHGATRKRYFSSGAV